MAKILGIDYGTVRIGLALSDEGWKYAFGHDTLNRSEKINVFHHLKKLCDDEEVKEIVLGMPLDQHGHQGQKAQEVLIFADQLKDKLNLPVNFEDERFTSVMAKKLFHEAEKKHRKNKGLIDQEAAKLILQSYLDKKNG